MANGERFNFLKDLVKTKKPVPKILGSGLAEKAGTVMASRKDYSDYVIKEQEDGNDPISFEDYKKLKGA